MTRGHAKMLDGIVIEPQITRSEIQDKLDSGEYVPVDATTFHYTADGHTIRVGDLALHLGDDGVKFVCGWPEDHVPGVGLVDALDAIVADYRTTPDGRTRSWSSAIHVERYEPNAAGGYDLARCERLTVQDGWAFSEHVPA
ncbi:hypothetical protein [Glycomyces sp. YM15]|uniref:hypothetical protein n=1 Tax=Glycomyces sp. YM15 TaxID=2800446 RepID=UPI001966BAC5|nr:hypothetical protein [Glycomyces sp. YM15]